MEFGATSFPTVPIFALTGSKKPEPKSPNTTQTELAYSQLSPSAAADHESSSRTSKIPATIFFAESDRNWLLDGAAVHTSMVGFDDGSETARVLDGEMVDRIHSDLSSRKADLTKAQRLRENQGIAFQGVILVGPFDVPEQEAQDMLLASNPDGAKNADVLKPLVTAKDITDRPSNRWVIDFGVSVTEDQAARYVGPFETLQQRVETKAELTSNTIRQTWWHFASARQHMRAALDGLERYVATPLHSKHRVFAWVDSPAIANHSVGVFAREDDYFIGVLQSRVHEIWSGLWAPKSAIAKAVFATPTPHASKHSRSQNQRKTNETQSLTSQRR